MPQKMSNTPLIRDFQKFFSRELSLVVMEYWFRGEYIELKHILEHKMYFNPLFISNGIHTQVYYDINNPDTDVQPLFDVAIDTPDTILIFAKEFENLQKNIRRLLADADPLRMEDLFNTVSTAWGYLPLWVQLGGADVAYVSKDIIDIAYRLRDEFQDVEYQAGETLLRMMQMRCPQYADFVDVLRIRECIENIIPDVSVLQQRRECGFIYFEDVVYPHTYYHTLPREHSLRIIDNLAIIGDVDSFGESVQALPVTDIVSGRTAYPGIISGLVRIITSVSDLSRVQDGDILVTTMTRPEYVPVMKKVAAIVTDEGGITCHAAIVAREMKKPCIIGTKIATKVLKDGDMVEVDANSGIVRIVK